MIVEILIISWDSRGLMSGMPEGVCRGISDFSLDSERVVCVSPGGMSEDNL